MNAFFPEGWLTASRQNRKNTFTPSFLSEAVKTGEILESVAYVCDSEHNLLVDLGSVKGIIPREEGAIGIKENSTRDIALISRVGKPVCFVVDELASDENGKLVAMLSRRKAQEKCRAEFLSTLIKGDVIGAKITHLESFGAFCDIGCGVPALLPIDSISVSRISHPKDRFKVGDDIKAVVKDISADGKITLTHKELLGTWQENADLFSVGQTVTGVVRSVEDYGIFVELTPNLAGLAELKSGVKVGDLAGVYIKNIMSDKMKVKLIIIDSFSGDYSPEITYFNFDNHIDRFDYSPESCKRKIFTDFNA
ncbi:MAG: S1 RNA-binding domain-containing protein [Ruminococcaceae bacterium]|nr:S1 RNA-binding domain-containing protein [Oscillospiraceae bacterium]